METIPIPRMLIVVKVCWLKPKIWKSLSRLVIKGFMATLAVYIARKVSSNNVRLACPQTGRPSLDFQFMCLPISSAAKIHNGANNQMRSLTWRAGYKKVNKKAANNQNPSQFCKLARGRRQLRRTLISPSRSAKGWYAAKATNSLVIGAPSGEIQPVK